VIFGRFGGAGFFAGINAIAIFDICRVLDPERS
jgi:hypothetical protein